MVYQNLQSLEEALYSLELTMAALHEVSQWILENTEDPKKVEVFSFMVYTLAAGIGGERDQFLDLINWLKKESTPQST